jgi:uracil-DNA glycosylase
MSTHPIETFLHLLKKVPPGAVFNPWWQVDPENDVGRSAPRIRREQLGAYFVERLEKARLAIVGEAVGYRGGHFSGIPMTSERILLEGVGDVRAKEILSTIIPRRTSKPQECARGFSEPTATIVWGTLLRLEVRPDEFVLWNAFPWHSFDPRRGLLSNRTPTKVERAAGLPVLKAFLELFPCERTIALGRIAVAQLKECGVAASRIRHPASGGAKLFREQIAQVQKSRFWPLRSLSSDA